MELEAIQAQEIQCFNEEKRGVNSVKKYINLIIIGLLLVIGSGYFIIKKVNFNELLLSAGYYDDKVTILNTSNVWARLNFNHLNEDIFSLDDDHVEMGMALVKHVADQYRDANSKTLMFDTGNALHGTPEASVDQGAGMVEAMNAVGYNASILGNNDYNWGWERVKEFKQLFQYPLLSANVYEAGEPAFQTYEIFELEDKKVGVFGLTTEQFLQNLQIYDTTGLTYEDPVKAAKDVVQQLKAEQVDVIILLSHLGNDLDRNLIVENVDGIDLILGAWSRMFFEKIDKVNDTYFAEAGDYTKNVGVAEIYFRNGEISNIVWSLQNERDSSKRDPVVSEIAERYRALAIELGSELVGVTNVELDGLRWHVRVQETNLANLVTDAMRESGEADITLFNGGGIRESIPAGDIDMYAIHRALPYINSLVTIELKGELIFEALEHGLIPWPDGASNGGFLQVSGMNYTIDGSQPAGRRVAEVTVDGKPLDMEKVYKVAITDYLLAGGDHYTVFDNAVVLKRGNLLTDVLADYIKSLDEQLSPDIEGRITIINQRYN